MTPDHEELLRRANGGDYDHTDCRELVSDLAAALRTMQITLESVERVDDEYTTHLSGLLDAERVAHEATKQRFSAHLHEPHPTIYPLTTDGAGFVAALTADLEKERAAHAETAAKLDRCRSAYVAECSAHAYTKRDFANACDVGRRLDASLDRARAELSAEESAHAEKRRELATAQEVRDNFAAMHAAAETDLEKAQAAVADAGYATLPAHDVIAVLSANLGESEIYLEKARAEAERLRLELQSSNDALGAPLLSQEGRCGYCGHPERHSLPKCHRRLIDDRNEARAELADLRAFVARGVELLEADEGLATKLAATQARLASAEAALQYEAGCDACPVQRPCTSCGGTRLAPVARAHFAKYKDPT